MVPFSPVNVITFHLAQIKDSKCYIQVTATLLVVVVVGTDHGDYHRGDGEPMGVGAVVGRWRT